MAKYRHRHFEMYDFRDEAASELMPKVASPVIEASAPETWQFKHLAVSRKAGVTFVEFASPEAVGTENLKEIVDDFKQLSSALGQHSKVLVDFSGVSTLPEGFIDALVQFNTNLRTKGSRIALCALEPAVREVFFAPR